MSDHAHEWIVFTGQGEDYVGCWACGAKRSCHDHIVTLREQIAELEEAIIGYIDTDTNEPEATDAAYDVLVASVAERYQEELEPLQGEADVN